ncbi:MAG TPA: alpha/beta hydrolase [Anaeromyxobacter sp.]|nr:alpha/beta hydrolase [Anaeromyxobacter sp.]
MTTLPAPLTVAGLAAPESSGGAPGEVAGAYAHLYGLHLYYEIHGVARAGSPPLLLLHGGGSTIQTSFGPILPLLARTRRVIAFEQQGHGHTSDIPDRPFSFEQSAKDAVALLRHLHVDCADVLGYSNGGHIAIQLALDHPEIVNRIVIESAMASRDGSDRAFWEGFGRATIDQMPRELREAYLATAPHPEELPTFFAKSVKRMAEFRGWSPDELGRIRSPALVLLGDRDVVRPEHGVAMYRWLPDASLCILPDTDHLAIVRHPEVAEIVERFLVAGAGAR